MNDRHRPVLAAQLVELLVTDPEGAYAELTAGLGGHLKAMAEVLGSQARLYGLDKDQTAVALAAKNLGSCKQKSKVIPAGYGEFGDVVNQLDDKSFDGILLDLGLSSAQLDDPARGFSFRLEGPLDMRFDPRSQRQTAAHLINSLSEYELSEIIRSFGEERRARQLAKAIVRARHHQTIQTTGQLADTVRKTVKPPYQTKSLARVFQALRIAVNRELDELQAALPKIFEHVKFGGRLAVISYHSLEDRIVKRFFQTEIKGCICPPELPECVCNRKPRAVRVTKKAITPGASEIEQNPRSRSAKLRIIERIAA